MKKTKVLQSSHQTERKRSSPLTEDKLYSPSGATSRSKARDYTLFTLEALNAIVDRHQFGIDKGHERNNWRLGKNDPVFITERMNHFFEHAIAIVTGVHPKTKEKATPEDVDAALCNLAMISHYQHNGNGLVKAFPYLDKKGIVPNGVEQTQTRTGSGVDIGRPRRRSQEGS